MDAFLYIETSNKLEGRQKWVLVKEGYDSLSTTFMVDEMTARKLCNALKHDTTGITLKQRVGYRAAWSTRAWTLD